MKIRRMCDNDAAAVLKIYAQGIEDRVATFETRCPTWQEWDENHLTACRLVADNKGTIVGWGALSPVSRRRCYRGVAEVSIYVAREARGRGVAFALLDNLVRASEQDGFWTLQGTTFEDNEASLRLQQRCGFRVVGIRERIGQMDGRWKTTLITERRSKVVGVDSPDGGAEQPLAPDRAHGD